MFEETATAEETQESTVQSEAQPFADLQPDTSDETAIEQPTTEDNQPTTEETEPAEEEYQLPDEQSKVFPEEELQKFADKRYPELAKLLADQALPEPTRKQVRQILHDKLNSDIRLKEIADAEEQEAEREEEQEQAPEPTQQADPEAWNQAVTQFVDNVTDEAVAEKFFTDLNAATALKDPKQRAVQFTKVLSAGMANLAKDLIPAILFGAQGQAGMLDNYIESRYEGLSESHTTALRTGDWDSVRQSDPAYANLPAFGTPEFIAAAQKAAALVPGIENAVFRDNQGKVLPPRQQFIEKSKLLAKLASGTATQSTVEKATKAVETGKRLQKESSNRKSLANLGAGQTKGQIAPVTQSGIDAARKESIARMRAEENPFAVLNKG